MIVKTSKNYVLNNKKIFYEGIKSDLYKNKILYKNVEDEYKKHVKNNDVDTYLDKIYNEKYLSGEKFDKFYKLKVINLNNTEFEIIDNIASQTSLELNYTVNKDNHNNSNLRKEFKFLGDYK